MGWTQCDPGVWKIDTSGHIGWTAAILSHVVSYAIGCKIVTGQSLSKISRLGRLQLILLVIKVFIFLSGGKEHYLFNFFWSKAKTSNKLDQRWHTFYMSVKNLEESVQKYRLKWAQVKLGLYPGWGSYGQFGIVSTMPGYHMMPLSWNIFKKSYIKWSSLSIRCHTMRASYIASPEVFVKYFDIPFFRYLSFWYSSSQLSH